MRIGLLFLAVVGTLVFVTGEISAQTEEDLLAVHGEMKQAINAQDPDGIMAVWADDCVYNYAALPQPFVGKEQIRQFFADLFTGFPDFHVEQRQILVSGNILVTECSTTGTNQGEWMELPATGAGPVPHIHMDIYEFEGTKIKKMTTYLDSATLMVSLGVMPEPEMPDFVPSFTPLEPEPSTLPTIELADQMVDTWNSHDMMEYSKYFKTDADVLVAVLGIPMNPSQFLASQEMYMAGFPDLHVEVTRRLDLGDGWLVEEHLYTGTHTGLYIDIPPTGKSVAVRGAVVNRFEGGLNTYFHSYWDHITLLTQIGVLGTSFSTKWELYE